jgi:type IV fimbrial biogenesis protein FimT
MSKSAPNASAGFTMTELVITMAIVAILAAIGVPSFRYVTASNRIASEINGLLGDMQFARSQAVKEGQSVTVCVSTNGTSCTGGVAWQSGWIVFLDANFNQQVDVAAGEKVIRVQPTFAGTDTFVAISGTLTAITYNRMGYAPTGITTNTTINLHDSTNTTAWTRCLQITPIGTPTTEKFGAGTPACT